MLTFSAEYEWTLFCRTWLRIGYEQWVDQRHPQLRRKCAWCDARTSSFSVFCSSCARAARNGQPTQKASA